MAGDIEQAGDGIPFDDYCEVSAEAVNGYDLRLLTLSEDKFDAARDATVRRVPAHYASPERIARILDRFGKDKAAAYVRDKLPKTPKIRSGDLAEVIATEYIDSQLAYSAPVKRLRWKDHRDMPMHGDDVIGIAVPHDDTPLRFLKSEVKSRQTVSTAVIEEARRALDGANGLPSPHSLAFISDRLHEEGREDLADRIALAQLEQGISAEQVQHLLFTFSGNAPDNFLKTDLENYDGPVRQCAAGLRVTKHQEFIAAVYEMLEGGHES